ncbi:fructokinase [Sphingomonas sp. IBVSS1]|nr:fructokinase [Sphingomonas sp. IBVSS1]
MTNIPLLAGIEAGGTKFVLAVGHAPDAITARHVIPTRTPAETLAEASAWFAAQGAIAAMGIASFGPVALDRASPRWGHITNTPKPGWADCDLAGHFARSLGVPVGFDTDVNGAALAEAWLGAGRDAGSLAYVTIGTGVGGGLILDGQLVHGAAHPEMGHMLPRRPANDADFPGICPHHGDCLEGLVCGPAIIARWGQPLSGLPADHPGHAIIADYLAQLCHTLIATTAVEIIVLGGGVMNTPGLIDRVRARTDTLGNAYFPGTGRHRILPPALADNSGITGALLLAQAAAG